MLKKTRIEQLLLEGKSVSEIAEIVPCTVDYANVVKSKLGIVNGTEQMVQHHTHYKELHGYDKTVWITRSEHSKLHDRLRENGKCTVPVAELKKIAMAAHQRTDKAKEYDAKYRKEQKYIEYVNSLERIKCRHDYYLKNLFEVKDLTHMMPYVSLQESIRYNMATNRISVSSGFYGSQNKKLFFIDII